MASESKWRRSFLPSRALTSQHMSDGCRVRQMRGVAYLPLQLLNPTIIVGISLGVVCKNLHGLNIAAELRATNLV